jgi:hypothetical protein
MPPIFVPCVTMGTGTQHLQGSQGGAMIME